MKSAFGVDNIRAKNASSQVVVADLATPNGVRLLWQWLRNPNIVGIFLAPPWGSASRARQIPLKRKRGAQAQDSGPRPRRTDDKYPRPQSKRTRTSFDR